MKNISTKKIMTEDDKTDFKKSKSCHICNKKYTKNDTRVRNHCHITGKYRGSAHNDCNLNFKLTKKIPVIFHNLRGYDSYFIMQQIGEIAKKHTFKNKHGDDQQMKINVIPNNMEKYMAFLLGEQLVFLDGFQIMSLVSLDKLAGNLPKEAFKYTSEQFKNDKFDLLIKKGVYPYDFMDSFDKFEQTKLPKYDEFYSILNDENITTGQYNQAQNVWNTFRLKNMGDYHDLYLESDVLLLTDVFENFRKTCLLYYKLDLCHYFTSPGLSWDAMLKMTYINLELMTDIDKFNNSKQFINGAIFDVLRHRPNRLFVETCFRHNSSELL